MAMMLAIGGVGYAGAPASATPSVSAGKCRGEDGISVVVDSTQFDAGGQVTIRCVRGMPDESLALTVIRTAGFSIQGTARFGDALVCRVDGRPSATEKLVDRDGRPHYETCANTPEASAYWTFWYSRPGQRSWTFSQQGVAGRWVDNGELLALVFQLRQDAIPKGGGLPKPGTGANPAPAPDPEPTPGDGDEGEPTKPAETAPPEPQPEPGPEQPAPPRNSEPERTSRAPGTGRPPATSRAPSTQRAPSPDRTSERPGRTEEDAGEQPGHTTSAPPSSPPPQPPVTPSEPATAPPTPSPTPFDHDLDGPPPSVRPYEEDPGLPWPTILAVLAALSLGGTAVVYALRRRTPLDDGADVEGGEVD
ncbi:hypothetical protein [Parenemella sanctibonifatiensis]|uniref:Uncharacterized protein n=1 Tax=Parenemella sanctibonifatiensis TaxID=2016505 RepID=A0A255ESB2_9ACTN|nr:hypothetical protein [Parenemella sanctibonifatiensis]OYN92485.1 hypothetical protein CGZ91_03095 [Parenemella sanctibonifatiensis]